MRVVISVKGRFHAFNLARELQKRHALSSLITSYPSFEVSRYGIDKSLVRSHAWIELQDRISRWLQKKLYRVYSFNPQYYIAENYDRRVAGTLEANMDVFTGWSSFSLHSLRRARQLGAVTVLERGSSHIQYQDDILRDEYDRFGIKPVLPHEKIIEKELNEYEEADYISVPSSYVYSTFIEQGIPEHKLVMNAYGVELDEFYPGNRQDNVFRVVYCGAMSLRKGVQYLMQAFSELSLDNAELLMVGDMLPEMEQIYDRYKSSSIKHRAAVKQSELRDIYITGSVFILPSIEEGMAMVQAQAMACGLPLLCTTNTGGGDLIEDGQQGFVIPIRDVAELKDKIEWFYCNQELAREMGHAASEKVKSGFTWNDYGMRMYGLYTDMLGAQGS